MACNCPCTAMLHLMIVMSDNAATNMILERFTADAVSMTHLDRIGIKTTRANRADSRRGARRGRLGGGQASRKREVRHRRKSSSTRYSDDARTHRARRNRQSRSFEGDDRRAQAQAGQHWHRAAIRAAFRWRTRRALLDALRADVGIVYGKIRPRGDGGLCRSSSRGAGFGAPDQRGVAFVIADVAEKIASADGLDKTK